MRFSIVIKLVTDKATIKNIKSGLTLDDIQHPAIRIDNWVYNAQIFRDLQMDENGFKPPADILNYLYCASYKDFLTAYGITKSSFVFDTFRRYKHYALEYQKGDDTYYFTVSYNSERGMDIIFYPHMIPSGFDAKAWNEFEGELYLQYANLMYEFLTEFYASILNHLFDTYDVNSIIDNFSKSFRNSDGTVAILTDFEHSRDITLIMPAL